jgi:RNA polymerase sigma-70 factor (ECF subfamily)
VRAGDREAFAPLLELFQRRLFGLALTMVRDPEGAEEVTQDAFVRAYTRLDLYDERRPFYPWLATIATRLAQNWLRRRGRARAREEAAVEAQRQTASGRDQLDRLIADERNRRLWRRVEALPSGERTAVALHYRQGMKVKDVARALGVTRGTVKTFLFRARQKLRAAMEDPGEDSPQPEEPR